jgi:hypothetical protein
MHMRIAASNNGWDRPGMTLRTIRPAPRTGTNPAGSPYLVTTATALALLGLATYALGVFFMLTRILSPSVLKTGIAVIRALPAVPLALLAMALVTIAMFEFAVGLWLLVKGVRILERT